MSAVGAVIFEERENQIHRKGQAPFDMDCNRESLAGAVSQRACVFCGSRVVLYPIADALHLVHGPIGCAAYTGISGAPCPRALPCTGSVSQPTSRKWISSSGARRSFTGRSQN